MYQEAKSTPAYDYRFQELKVLTAAAASPPPTDQEIGGKKGAP
jgi:hypothetical protein